jgi:hypothetical protein
MTEPMTKQLIRKWRRQDGGTADWNAAGSTMTATSPAFERAKKTAEEKAKAAASRIPKI